MAAYKNRELTAKQVKFVQHYLLTGDELVSAHKAGYQGGRNTLRALGKKLLRKPHVAEAIRHARGEAKPDEPDVPPVATRDERLKLLTDIARTAGDNADRIRAIQLLEKMDESLMGRGASQETGLGYDELVVALRRRLEAGGSPTTVDVFGESVGQYDD